MIIGEVCAALASAATRELQRALRRMVLFWSDRKPLSARAASPTCITNINRLTAVLHHVTREQRRLRRSRCVEGCLEAMSAGEGWGQAAGRTRSPLSHSPSKPPPSACTGVHRRAKRGFCGASRGAGDSCTPRMRKCHAAPSPLRFGQSPEGNTAFLDWCSIV